MRYMLITVCEREIFTEIFDDYLKAYNTMINEFCKFVRIDISECQHPSVESPDGEFGYGANSAYVNDGVNHDNYDWVIVEI